MPRPLSGDSGPIHRILIALSCVLLLASCAHRSVTAVNEGELSYAARNAQIKIEAESQHMHARFQKKGLLLADPRLDDYLDGVMSALTEQAGIPRNSVAVYVVRDPNPNAFATPNGNIYFTTGLLSVLDHSCQIEFIAQHELAHYVLRHPLRGYLQRQSQLVTASVVDTLLVGTAIAYIPAALGTLSYSRDMEREADSSAIDTLSRNAHLGEPVAEVFIKMQQYSPKGNDDSVWNSHPSNDERSTHIKEALQTNGAVCIESDTNPWTEELQEIALYHSAKMALLQKRFELARRLHANRGAATPRLEYVFGETFRRADMDENNVIASVRFMEDVNAEQAKSFLDEQAVDFLAMSKALLESAQHDPKYQSKSLRALALIALSEDDLDSARRIQTQIASIMGKQDYYLESQIENWMRNDEETSDDVDSDAGRNRGGMRHNRKTAH